MTRIISLSLVLAAVSFGGQSDSDHTTRCHPQLIRPGSSSPHLRPKPGASFKGYKRSPIVTFDVDESGTVRNARIKRSSGALAADQLALAEVRQWKYKPLPGCGIAESKALVTIDFSSQ
ncbi:MAG TPA: TonB family protein [Candidatus Sulfotelmatobacter sp.]|nr:TonB family protein [Candidatus Sulfotelmatobacter sp.]